MGSTSPRILPAIFIFVFFSLNFHVQSLSLTKTSEQNGTADAMAADMLSISRSNDISAACPKSDTFCLPRVRCPVKNVIYDRESLRFMLGEQDNFGCGAFSPTWTYVCCSTLDKLEAGNWSPKPDLWFFPPGEGSTAKNVDPSAAFPVLLPWPGYKNSSSTANNPSTTSKPSAFLSDEDKAILHGSRKDQSTEKSAEKQQNERSAMDQIPFQAAFQPQQQQSFPQFMMNDPRFNPLFNPNAMNQQSRMFPPNNFMDPWFGNQQQDPRMMQQQQPVWSGPPVQSDWTEMILIFPDGSAQRTFRDRLSGFGQTVVEPPRRTLADSPPPFNAPPMQNIAMERTTQPPSRIQRSTDSKGFKVPSAKGGMWTGNKNVSSNGETDAEGRALLPKPNAQWGAPPGSGNNAQFQAIPAIFNVNSDRCGLSASTGINARVLSGRKPGSQMEAETSFGQFPWHAAVVNGETGDYLCAATIISARFVLTVAHCVRKFQLTLLFVRIGDWDLSTTAEMMPSYDVEVANVIVHEEFYAGNMQNDIALLQLRYPLDFGFMPHVGSICLPPSSEPIYSDCLVTGWGQQLSTTEAKGDTATFSRTLKQTSQTLVTAQFCEKSLRPFLGQFYQLPKKGFVCAYDKDGKDSCFGDGGGALACLVNAPGYPKANQYHVVGLVSWGVGCGMPSVPSAYTAVWDYVDWIHSKISPLDAYTDQPMLPSKEAPLPPIMVRSNIPVGNADNAAAPTTATSPTTVRPTTSKPKDFIDLAFL